MSHDPTAEHLALAEEHLDEAQTAANRAASDSYMHDIPAGNPTRYGLAACRADRISTIRTLVRQLLDHPPHRSRPVASASPDVPADAP